MTFIEELISSEFGVPQVDIKQNLSQSFDVFSGIHISESSGTSFNNTELGLNKTNIDGRIPLGLFYFDEDNKYPNNFINKMTDSKFIQLPVENLVENGNGRFVKSFFTRPTGDSTSGNGYAFIPEGGWGYCRYDGVGVRQRNDDSASADYAYQDELGGSFPEFDNDSGQNDGGGNFIKSFRQDPNFNTGTADNQNEIGYAGYLPYHGIGGGGELDADLQTCLEQAESNANDDSTKNLCYEFFHLVGKIDGSTRHSMTPMVCTLTNPQVTSARFPNIATWVSNTNLPGDGASFDRCLRFLPSSYQHGQFDDSNDGSPYDETLDTFSGWGGSDARLKGSGDTLYTHNQYRTLNQVIRIYQAFRGFIINPFTTLTVKFRMCTMHGSLNNMPEVEVAIIDGDGSVGNPKRPDFVDADRNADLIIDEGEGWKLPKNFHYWPHGDFNTLRYSDDINDTGTLTKKYSNYGSMGRFKNSALSVWETFSYKFNLAEKFKYGGDDGILRDLHLLVQAGNEYTNQAAVYLDDFEVYESEDFVPDVDVRKKISVGEYGKGNLTEYYDKDLQPEEYKDTTAPLEAQFYFYPAHPSDEVFDIKRTPVYQDFKKGLFYIYDVDWGDGSPNEFKSKPEQIDEETSLYHTYKNHGIFEITGTMIRVKEDKNNNKLGIICNKNFTLTININEGVDEDFQYFGSDGFSFIPYKNTTPIIGGYSNQSIYYKSIYRQLGFMEETDYAGTITNFYYYILDPVLPSLIDLSNDYPYGEDFFDTDGDGIPDSSFPMGIHASPVSAQKYFEIINEGVGNPDEYIYEAFTDNGFNVLYSWEWVEEQNSWKIRSFADAGFELEGYGVEPIDHHVITQITGRREWTSTTTEVIKVNVGFKNKGDKFKTEMALMKMDATVREALDIVPFYEEERTDNAGEIVNTGLTLLREELGKSIGDTDITNIKYYSKPKSMSEMLGFPVGETHEEHIEGIVGTHDDGMFDWGAGPFEDPDVFPTVSEYNTDEDFLSQLPFPHYFEEFNIGGGSGINNTDKIQWELVGRPDIGIYIMNEIILGGYTPPPGGGAEQPTEHFWNTLDMAIFLIELGISTYACAGVFGGNGHFSEGDYDITPQIGTAVDSEGREWKTFNCHRTVYTYFNNPETPGHPSYWKNIIPKDYSIYNREGLDGDLIDTYSEQDWLDDDGDGAPDFYWPVLPKYGSDGKFIEGDYPNGKIPFPQEGPITNENENNKNLLINITSETIENNVLNDNSGNQNLGFYFSDYRPKFDKKTLEPKKNKTLLHRLKISTSNGVF